ncbi:Mechanosensitive ion channel-domain-containing protein [Paraphysoderma sedebokerense]|nr:Mechanosensitive ion channel-domain-containing protein [Paraphysoderma sedebokerense]
MSKVEIPIPKVQTSPQGYAALSDKVSEELLDTFQLDEPVKKDHSHAHPAVTPIRTTHGLSWDFGRSTKARDTLSLNEETSISKSVSITVDGEKDEKEEKDENPRDLANNPLLPSKFQTRHKKEYSLDASFKKTKKFEDDDGFDWDNSSDEDKPTEEKVTDSQSNLADDSHQPLWERIPEWTKSLIIFFILNALFIIPGLVSYLLPTVPNVLNVTLWDWTLFLCSTVIGYYVLLLLFHAVLFIMRRHSLTNLEYLEQLRQLYGWFKLVIFFMVALICEWVILHRVQCPDVAVACTWVLFWLKDALLCCFISSILFTIQKLSLQRIAVDFHQTSYAERLKELNFAERSLDLLDFARKQYKLKMKRCVGSGLKVPESRDSPSEKWSLWFYGKGDLKIVEDPKNHTKSMPILSSSPSPKEELLPAEEKKSHDTADAKSVKTAEELKLKFFENLGIHVAKGKIPKLKINSSEEAKMIAKRLFHFISKNRKELLPQDFTCFYAEEEERDGFFKAFDKNADGKIDKKEWKNVVLNTYHERKNLSRSLNQLEYALNKLDRLMMGMVAVLNLVVWLLVFNVNVFNLLVSLTSIILAFAFVIGGMAKNFFESLVFLFVIHPFDIGDKIYIDNEMFFVERMDILTTVLKKPDGNEVYYPNGQLVHKAIQNTRRAGDMMENIFLDVPFDIQFEQLLELKSKIGDHMKSHPGDFGNFLDILTTEIIDGHKLRLTILVQYKGNFQNGSKRWERRNKLVFFIRDTLKHMGIRYYPLPQKIELIGGHSQNHSNPHVAHGGFAK